MQNISYSECNSSPQWLTKERQGVLLHHHFFPCTLFQNLNVFLQHSFPILQSFLFQGSSLISGLQRLARSLSPGRRPASPMIPDLVRLQFHLSFVPFPLFELQFQIEFLTAPYFDRQCPVTDFFFDVLNIFVTNRPWTPDF